jgi:hypothetical protein
MLSSRNLLLSSSSTTRQHLVSKFSKESYSSMNPILPVALCNKVDFFSTVSTTTTPTPNRIVETIDPNSDEYYEGHLLTDQLEYIDVIMDKAVEIEESIDRLQTLYKQKKAVAMNVQWMTANDIEELFQESQQQKKRIKELVANVKELSSEVKGRIFYNGVDAPDGTSDDMVKKDMEAVDSIIYNAWEQQKRDEQAIKIKANCHSHR